MTEKFVKRTPLPVSADELFAWHERPGAFERLNPAFDPVVVEERSGGLEVGARTVIKLKVGPVSQRWVSVHTSFERGRMFRDEQESGPFATWVHTHRFEPQPDGTSVMHDEVDYSLPMGAVGAALGAAFTRSSLERTFTYRHTVLRNDLLRHSSLAGTPRLTVAITGASGLIGSALGCFLSTGGHAVRVVKRQGSVPDVSALEGSDVIVNLAGAGVADERWTDARKEELVRSRVQYTRALVKAMKALRSPPRLLVQGSAIGIYGERGDELLTESSAPGPRGDKAAAFLAGLCADWEAEGAQVETFGARVVMLRTGLVQSASGGALAKLVAPFKAGAGGPLGSGRQWQSWVSLEDVLGIIQRALWDERLRGPVNCVGPAPVTNAEYGRVLGHVLARPAVMPLPAFAMRAAFGELAEGALLASQRVVPSVLEQVGFSFLHPTLEGALRFTLGRAE
jgi:uncharacterized protein (TIGR01777 family)